MQNRGIGHICTLPFTQAGSTNPAIKQTTGIQNLDAHDYFDTPTVFPPLGEQRLIADFLDEKTRRIEALCSTTELAIERLQEYRTALITAAVTGKIDVRDREMVETGASV